MQRDAAGIPTDKPTMNREAEKRRCQIIGVNAHQMAFFHSQISHHTGAVFRTLSFQMTELMKALRQPTPAQNMYRQVPVFHAAGNRSDTSPMEDQRQKAYLLNAKGKGCKPK
jgi:hypothetical protein